MEEILVPTDFTGISDTAAEAALKLARSADSEVVFLHLISIPPQVITNKIEQEVYEREIMSKIKEKNKKLENYIKLANEDLVFATKAIQMDVNYQSMIEFVIKNQIFLIVIGTHGAKGAREFMVGSSAQKIARYSPVPVLIVKAGYGANQYKRLAFFSQFEMNDIDGFDKVCSLAEKFHFKIHLVTVDHPDITFNKELFYRKIKYFKNFSPNLIEKVSITKSLSLESGIEEYSNQNSIDLISMVTHKRSGVKKITDSSITEKIINHVKVPILTVHNSTTDEYLRREDLFN